MKREHHHPHPQTPTANTPAAVSGGVGSSMSSVGGSGGGYSMAAAGKSKLWEDGSQQDAGNDELLAMLGYKVKSSDMAEVAQKMEQLEEVMGSVHEDGLSYLASEKVHNNPSDISIWLENMLSELNPNPTAFDPSVQSLALPPPPPPIVDDTSFLAPVESSNINFRTGLNHHHKQIQKNGQMYDDSGLDYDLKAIPDAERWHADRITIDLSNNELSNLPDEPMCPNLWRLYLQKNYKLRKIPPAFFTNMPLLQILDLSNTSIKVLPKSLFELPLLNELMLRKCEFLMILPPEVEKLKQLEVLDMEGTEIINLPIEIKELSGLRRLRVSLYGCLDHDGESRRQSNEMIPSGLISALSKLEEVSIDVNPDDERWDACVEGILNEICGLAELRILGFYFPRVELLSCLIWTRSTMIYQSRFKLIVGGHFKRIISRLPSNVELELNTRYGCLKYINGKSVPEVIKEVLPYATTFHLDRHMTARKLTEFGVDNMEFLKYCVLGECNEMQVIIDGNDVHNHQIVRGSSGAARWFGLESLEFLYIYYMKNLKSIWEGPTHKRCLYGLKSLSLSTCPQLTTIFTVGLLESLRNLEELTVRDCPAIKSLVICEEGVKQSASYLPKLRTISLYYVPELVSISSEVCVAPKLEKLSLYNCPKLKSLSIKEVSSKHLTKITGETDWWEALELTQVQRDKFDGIFVPINADTWLSGGSSEKTHVVGW